MTGGGARPSGDMGGCCDILFVKKYKIYQISQNSEKQPLTDTHTHTLVPSTHDQQWFIADLRSADDPV